MTTTGTGECALGQNCREKKGGHTCLALSEVEKPHLASKEVPAEKKTTKNKKTTQTCLAANKTDLQLVPIK